MKFCIFLHNPLDLAASTSYNEKNDERRRAMTGTKQIAIPSLFSPSNLPALRRR